MKRFSKILLAAACVAVLGCGTAFAGGKGGKGDDGFGRGMHSKLQVNPDGTMKPATDYIGQVTAVDEKAGTIKVADLDGKESTITVNPFTQIRCDDSKDDKAITDIKKGDWIMYSFYNTETEKKLASRIFVKK